MMSELWLTFGMFGALILSIMLGVSLSFAMGSIAVVAGLMIYGPNGLMSVITPVFNYMWMLLLSAVPLFVLMGVALSNSKIAETMYQAFHLWSGTLRGGLALGSCGFAAALSAMTGNCSASTLTAGLVGIPPMRRRGYDDKIIYGTIGSAGTLGILIPPSISLIIIGMMTGQSVGRLFAGGLAAGLIILSAFMVYILVRAYLNPNLCPAMEQGVKLKVKIKALQAVAFPLFIIAAVLGTIFAGIATPTEAASVGVFAVMTAVAFRGELTVEFLKKVTHQTAEITGMVLWIMFGAGGFVAVYAGGGGVYFIQDFLSSLELNPWLLMIGIQMLILVLGMFLDPMGIVLLCLPIFFPVIKQLGFDPIWFAILFNVNLCIGYLTPPFGYNLFYLKSLDPKMKINVIYKSMLPFIAIMLICEAAMFIFPELITYLPGIMVAR